MIQQVDIFEMSRQTGLRRKPSGPLVTAAPLAYATSPINGDAQICKHTSCGLSINENADPDVRVDMETIFNRIVPENRPEYEHMLEGADDMPAHAKSTLGIGGVISSVYSWRAEANEEHPGAQVDLLIDRRDDIINLCEMKYADDEYAFDNEEERKLRNRKTAFKLDTKTRKSVHTTLVTTYGLRKNSHSDIVQSVVTMDDLFRD